MQYLLASISALVPTIKVSEQDIQDEIRAHLNMAAQDHAESGEHAADAAAGAVERIGDGSLARITQFGKVDPLVERGAGGVFGDGTQVADAHAAHAAAQRCCTSLELGGHSALRHPTRHQCARRGVVECGDQLAAFGKNPSDIRHQHQFVRAKRNGDGGGGIITVHVQPAALRIIGVPTQWGDDRNEPPAP